MYNVCSLYFNETCSVIYQKFENFHIRMLAQNCFDNFENEEYTC